MSWLSRMRCSASSRSFAEAAGGPVRQGGSGLPRGGGPGSVPALAEELPGRPGHAGQIAPGSHQEKRAGLAPARSPLRWIPRSDTAAPGHAALSSAPHSEEEGLQDLEPHRERQMPAPVKEDPTADTRIHRSEGPSVPRRHPGARAAPVGPPPASLTSVREGLDSRSRRDMHSRLSVRLEGWQTPPSCWTRTARIGCLGGRL
jgi:hypothetical protein